jgi:hypothetical protein
VNEFGKQRYVAHLVFKEQTFSGFHLPGNPLQRSAGASRIKIGDKPDGVGQSNQRSKTRTAFEINHKTDQLFRGIPVNQGPHDGGNSHTFARPR